jgi:hypothetical protein
VCLQWILQFFINRNVCFIALSFAPMANGIYVAAGGCFVLCFLSKTYVSASGKKIYPPPRRMRLAMGVY